MASLEDARKGQVAVLSNEATDVRGIRLNVGVSGILEAGH
jgi:hypothetical protein